MVAMIFPTITVKHLNDFLIIGKCPVLCIFTIWRFYCTVPHSFDSIVNCFGLSFLLANSKGSYGITYTHYTYMLRCKTKFTTPENELVVDSFARIQFRSTFIYGFQTCTPVIQRCMPNAFRIWLSSP